MIRKGVPPFLLKLIDLLLSFYFCKSSAGGEHNVLIVDPLRTPVTPGKVSESLRRTPLSAHCKEVAVAKTIRFKEQAGTVGTPLGAVLIAFVDRQSAGRPFLQAGRPDISLIGKSQLLSVRTEGWKTD
jgi:hypothetical protein